MSSEQAGQRVGDYEILGALGAGGMGRVFKVRNVISDRIEAMKILLPDLAGQKELAERFQREIKLLAGLNHPNIAALRTALTIDNQLVMIMEYVEGITLSARLQQGPVPPAEAADYIEQVLMALGYAHRQKIIHRDVKPANMMLTPQGLVKLMDFGIARSAADQGLTVTGTTLGSLYYMSPEQIKGEAVDARSDLYSAGVSLYELVTGKRPFQADSNYSLMAQHIQDAPKPPIDLQPGLPASLNQIILMAMAKDPGQRFQSAEAFDNALRSVAAKLPKAPADAAAAVPAPAAPVVAQPPAPAPVPAAPTATAIQTPTPPPSAVPPVAVAAATDTSAPPAAPPVAPASGPAAVAPPRPAPAMPPPVLGSAPRSSRGLYMALGALLVVAVLAVAAIYGPRWARARASGQAGQQAQAPAPAASTPATSAPAAPAPPPDAGASPPAAGSTAAAPADSANSTAGAAPTAPAASAAEPAKTTPSSEPPSSRPAKKGTGESAQGTAAPASSSADASGSAPAPPAPGAQAGATASPPPVDTAALDDLEHQLDQLTGRAGAVKDSIDKLRNEMSAQGSNLRGDINASEQRMETAMSRAQTALQNQDARKTKQYLDQAETEVERLEKFLGQR